MRITGDIPVGLVEELYYRLEDNGIYVEDFIVDANEGYVNIVTSVPYDEADIWEPILNDKLWNVISHYVDDIVDSNLLEETRSFLKNERGFISPITLAISSAATSTILATSNASGALSELTLNQKFGVFALLGYIGLITVGLMWAGYRYYED